MKISGPIARAFPLIALLACGGGDATGPGGSGSPAALIIVSGDAQSGVVGTELSSPLVVKVTDASGAPVKGQVVNFKVVAGGGSVFAGAAGTNADGVAKERWTLGTVPGDSQRVEVRAVDPTTGAPIVFETFRATAVAGPPAAIKKATADSLQVSIGTAITPAPRVRLTDKFGNSIAGATVTFVATAGGGTIANSSQVTSDSGFASVGAWTTGTTEAVNILSVSVQGSPAVTTTFTASAHAYSLSVANGGGQSASVDDFLPRDPGFLVVDFGGRPVRGVPVAFAVTDGSLSATSVNSDANGLALVRWRLGGLPRRQVITATILGGVTSTIAVTARAVVAFATQSNNQRVAPGSVLPVSPAVRLTRLDGAAVSGVTINFSPSGDGSVSDAAVVTDASGNATTQWKLATVTGTNILTATVGDSVVRTTAVGTGPLGPIAKVRVGVSNQQPPGIGRTYDTVTLVPNEFRGPIVVDAFDELGNDLAVQSSTERTVSFSVPPTSDVAFVDLKRGLYGGAIGTRQMSATVSPDGKTGTLVINVVPNTAPADSIELRTSAGFYPFFTPPVFRFVVPGVTTTADVPRVYDARGILIEGRPVTWTTPSGFSIVSSNGTQAVLAATGALGTNAVVTAKVDGVVKSISHIIIGITPSTIRVGQTLQLRVVGMPTDNALFVCGPFAFLTSNGNIAQVSGTSVIGVATGTTNLHAQCNHPRAGQPAIIDQFTFFSPIVVTP